MEKFEPNLTPDQKPELESEEKKEREQEKEETKIWESREFEADLVLENPEFVGINFDQSLIVDSRMFWDIEKCKMYLEERGDDLEDSLFLLTEEQIRERIRTERLKLLQFNEYFEKLKGKVKYIRINPAGEMSPVSPSQAIEVISENEFRVNINKDFLEQLRTISKNCNDITLVVPFYNHRRGKEKRGDIPETNEEIDQYIVICEKIIEEAGDKIILEIGNETNVSKKTGAMFRDKLQHLSKVDIEQYVDFYIKVAKRLKERFPKLRLAVSGIACYDMGYLRKALQKIKQIEPNKELFDRISFHPYRSEPEKGSATVKDGDFVFNELNYSEQLEKMKEVASEYEVDMRVGEINFPINDINHQLKLRKAIELTKEGNIKSLIYPGVNTP